MKCIPLENPRREIKITIRENIFTSPKRKQQYQKFQLNVNQETKTLTKSWKTKTAQNEFPQILKRLNIKN